MGKQWKAGPVMIERRPLKDRKRIWQRNRKLILLLGLLLILFAFLPWPMWIGVKP